MAQEDHVQRQEQARGSSQAEFCHYMLAAKNIMKVMPCRSGLS